MILAVMNAIYAVAYIEAWKIQDFNGVSTRDLAIPVRRSNQLSYEATDVGSWSSVGSNKTMKNECELIYEIFQRRKQGNWKKKWLLAWRAHSSRTQCDYNLWDEAWLLVILLVDVQWEKQEELV